MKKALAIAILSLHLTSCTALTSLATNAVMGEKGGLQVDAGVQLGKENTKITNKGLASASLSQKEEVDIGDVTGNALVGSGNTITNKTSTMIGLVLAGMLPPLVLLFYFLPSPRWLSRRYSDTR